MHTELLGAEHPRQLVLLHGWGHSSAAMRPLGELLATRYQVHLIDLPGFGASPLPEEAWSVFQYADKIARYLEDRRCAKAGFVGHSFGGKVALAFGASYPEKIDKLALIATSALLPQRSWVARLRHYAIRYGGKVLKQIDRYGKAQLFERYFIPRWGSKDYQKAQGLLRTILVKAVNQDLSKEASLIQAPTLLLWGEQDQETPLEIALRLQAMIASSQLIALPYHDHCPMEDVGAHLMAHYLLPFFEDSLCSA